MAIGNLKIENYVPAVRLNEGIYTEYDIETTGNLIVGGDITLTDDLQLDDLTVTGDASVGGALTVTGSALFDRLVTNVTGATLSPAAADSGTLYTLNKADGVAVTLPAAAAGLWYEFVFSTGASGGSTTITAASGDLLVGGVTAVDTDSSNAVVFDDPDASDDLIMTFNGTTQGGLIGTYVKLYATTANQWLVTGFNRHSSNFATIFS